MKQTLAGLALGVLLAVSSASHADTTVGTAEINITYIEGWSPENWDISLSSHTPQTVAVSLNTLNRDLQYWPAEDAGGAGTQAGNAHWSVLEVEVRDGYRVTGVAVHALAYGELSAGELPDQPAGSADNGARLAWFVTAPGLSLPFSTQFTTFSGFQPFANATGPLDLDDTFRVSFDAAVWAQAVAATASDGSTASSAALASIGSAVLLVQVAPVPEPASWAMLLGGLAGLSVWQRRVSGRRNGGA